MNLIKKATFLSIAWLLGLIVVLVFFEIALRIIYYDETKIIRIPRGFDAPKNFQYDYDISKIYPAEETIVRYVKDEFGFRNSCGDPSNIDILTVGGSTTAQRYVKNESTFQAVLETLMLSDTGKEICVANAGLAGHSTYGHIKAFEQWFPNIPNLKPKYVLLYIGINDALLERIYDVLAQRYKGKKEPIVKSFIRSTYLAQKTRPFFKYLKAKREREEVAFAGRGRNIRYSLEDYTATALSPSTIVETEKTMLGFRQRLEFLLRQIEEFGSIPICVTQPHQYVRLIDGKKHGIPRAFRVYGKVINGKLHKTAKSDRKYSGLDYDYSLQQLNKIIYELCGNDKVIDIYSVEFPEGAFYDGVHTTDIGSEFLGKKMFKAMKQKGMLEVF